MYFNFKVQKCMVFKLEILFPQFKSKIAYHDFPTPL